MKRIPKLEARENEHLIDILMELGLEMKGLKDLTNQNITKVDKT